MANIIARGKNETTGSYQIATPSDVVVDGSGVPLAGGGALPARYAQGLRVAYASATTCTVSSGSCRDNANAGNIVVASDLTLDRSVAGAINGEDSLTLTGTVTRSGLTVVDGAGTAFLTEFGTRVGTGTITTVGTAITGAGTLFLSELAVNDLIGNAANGYFLVASIESDLLATLSIPFAGGDVSGIAYDVIEQPTIDIPTSGFEPRKLLSIESDILLVVQGSGIAGGAGGETAVAGRTEDAINLWAAIWVVSGGSGSGGLISTQRTTLLNPPTGYTTSQRRVGWQNIRGGGSNADFLGLRYDTDGIERTVHYTAGEVDFSNTLLSGGTSATYADILASTLAPPTAVRVFTRAQLTNVVGVKQTARADFRQRNTAIGAGLSYRSMTYQTTANGHHITNQFWQPVDGAQAYQYQRVSGSNYTVGASLDGFVDIL